MKLEDYYVVTKIKFKQTQHWSLILILATGPTLCQLFEYKLKYSWGNYKWELIKWSTTCNGMLQGGEEEMDFPSLHGFTTNHFPYSHPTQLEADILHKHSKLHPNTYAVELLFHGLNHVQCTSEIRLSHLRIERRSWKTMEDPSVRVSPVELLCIAPWSRGSGSREIGARVSPQKASSAFRGWECVHAWKS